jgi:hypothetical protein
MRHSKNKVSRIRCLTIAALMLTICQGAVLAQTSAGTPVPDNPTQSKPITNNTSSAESIPADTPLYGTPVPAVADDINPFRKFAMYDPLPIDKHLDQLGSAYIPVDSPIYPMVMRLYSLGFLDTGFLDMRPWTRRSLLHALDQAKSKIVDSDDSEAMAMLASLDVYLSAERKNSGQYRKSISGIDTIYSRVMGISGHTLRDSYHLGQTIVNDYGRPYEPGFNNITGFSSVNEIGAFSLYVRGEFQHSPSAAGYSQALSAQLSSLESVPFSGYNLNQATIPTGPIAGTDAFVLQEATVSYHLLGHEISGGKSDAWEGPGLGGAMGYSNNAQDIYSLRINRVEPLHIPFVSAVTGPFRYDFFVGSLKGHTDPNSPWFHSETISFAPTVNLRIGFQRSVIWGGAGHEPVTIHTFLRSFFSLDDTETDPNVKYTSKDPGARFSAFNFAWRLPYLRRYVTLYTDSISHDDVTPPSAPRRAAYRPGVYLSQIPGVRKLDFRIEGASTDTATLRSLGGAFNYFEAIQRQGYTNKGFIMGDWIGREAKGGQAWLTYHLSANEWLQLQYMHKKTPKDFIAGGTSQNQISVDFVKRLRKNLELDAWFQFEAWKAPIYIAGSAANKNTTTTFKITWYPQLHN